MKSNGQVLKCCIFPGVIFALGPSLVYMNKHPTVDA